MCQHRPQCPSALASDRMAARIAVSHPEQGWNLLCNGIVTLRRGIPVIGPANWREDAACLRTDPDLFFPIASIGPALDQIEEAKRICATCPVRTPCLTWALEQGAVSGIWGGTTEAERRAMRRATARYRTYEMGGTPGMPGGDAS